MPYVRGIVRSSAADGYRFSTLLTNIVLSDEFVKARVPEAAKPLAPLKTAAVLK